MVEPNTYMDIYGGTGHTSVTTTLSRTWSVVPTLNSVIEMNCPANSGDLVVRVHPLFASNVYTLNLGVDQDVINAAQVTGVARVILTNYVGATPNYVERGSETLLNLKESIATPISDVLSMTNVNSTLGVPRAIWGGGSASPNPSGWLTNVPISTEEGATVIIPSTVVNTLTSGRMLLQVVVGSRGVARNTSAFSISSSFSMVSRSRGNDIMYRAGLGSVSVSNFPVSQPVVVSNFPATQNVTGSVTASGSVSVNNFPSSTSVSNFPASVSVSNFPSATAVSGSVAVTNWPATTQIAGSVGVTSVAGDVSVKSSAVSPLMVGVQGTARVESAPGTSISVVNAASTVLQTNVPVVTINEKNPDTGVLSSVSKVRIDLPTDYTAISSTSGKYSVRTSGAVSVTNPVLAVAEINPFTIPLTPGGLSIAIGTTPGTPFPVQAVVNQTTVDLTSPTGFRSEPLLVKQVLDSPVRVASFPGSVLAVEPSPVAVFPVRNDYSDDGVVPFLVSNPPGVGIEVTNKEGDTLSVDTFGSGQVAGVIDVRVHSALESAIVQCDITPGGKVPLVSITEDVYQQ